MAFQEDFSSGIPATWTNVDVDGLTPNSAVSEFVGGWIWRTTSTDSVAACSSYFQDTIANAEDYLITPRLTLATLSKFSWEARSVDASYPEGYIVMISTDSVYSSFTDTIHVELIEDYLWNRKSINLDTMGYANQDVFIAFLHNSQNGFILELDNVMLETSDFASLESTEEPRIQLYPNPASNWLSISGEFEQAEIHSLDGKLYHSFKTIETDVSQLPAGMFLVTVYTKDAVHTERLIIER